MKKFKKALSVILALLITASVCTIAFGVSVSADENQIGNKGKTYYVDAENGDDHADGLSETKAWKTLKNVNNTTFEPGSAILLKRGCVWKDTFLWPKGAGDKNNMNYISCYGDEELDLPYIASVYDDALDGLPDTDTCLYLGPNQNYWDVSNLSLYNATNGTGDQYVANVRHTDSTDRITGVSIHDCVINGSNPSNWSINSRSGLTGIAVSGRIDDVLIENNQISNVKAVGISVNGGIAGCNYKGEVNSASAKNVVVRGNNLYNIGKDGILTNNCVEPLVEYNVCGMAHSYAKTSAHVAMWPFACYGALFQYNESYDTKTIFDGQGFDCDYQCYNTTFQYNYSHNNTGGFMLICTEAKDWNGGYAYNVGSTVRYNISQCDSHYTFTLCDAIESTRIYNNTIYASRNSGTATHAFFSLEKGTNLLNNRNLPHDTLIANNIFWLDSMKNFGLDSNTETVMKNNLYGGRYSTAAPANGTVTQKGADTSGNMVYYYREVKDNIFSADPLFVNGGYAEMGRDSCDVYKLYEGSPAIGKGIYIEDGFHKCPTDFFGNAIDKNNVNIGAYQGKPVARTNYIFDSKYYKMIDFEDNNIGAKGNSSSGVRMSSISRCTEATNTDKAYVDITDKYSALNSKTKSQKALRFVNNNDSDTAVSVKFYTLKTDLQNANGIRIYFDPNGVRQSYTVSFDVVSAGKTVTYSKTITVSTPGYRVFTFNEKYTNSNNARVTPEVMRTMTAISIKATLAPDREAYVDDIQVNNGAMDEIETDELITNEKADVTLVDDFEKTTVGDNTNYGNAISGPNGTPRGGSAICPNGTKAIYVTSNTSSITAYSGRFLYKDAFNNLKTALKNDTTSEGIQFNLYTVALVDGVELTDEQKYVAGDRYNKYKIEFNGANLTYTKPDGNTVTLSSFTNGDAKLQTDSNDLCRIPFSDLYATYTENGNTVKVYLTSLSSADQQTWKESISSIKISYTTIGKVSGAGVFQYTYLDNLSVFKNVQHIAGDWEVISAASCTQDGVQVKHCISCNRLMDTKTTKAPGHTYGEWVVTKKATCEEAGEEQVSCTVCKKVIKTKTISALNHNYKQTVVKPTCTKEGYTAQICANCGDVKDKTNIVAPTGHKNTKWVVDKASTCTENGSSHEICLDCNTVLQTATELAGHKYEVTVVNATCEQGGYTLHKCKDCKNEYKTDEVTAKGHTKSADWVVTKQATCFRDGEEVKYCTNCNKIIETRTISKTAHVSSDDWTVVRQATCYYEGLEVKYCTSCNKIVETRATHKIAHTPSEKWTVIKQPTAFDDGIEVKYCVVCSEIVSRRNIDKLTGSSVPQGSSSTTTANNNSANNQGANNTVINPTTTVSTIVLKKPVLSKPKLSKGKAVVKYKAVSGATKYEVYVLNKGKWKKYSTKKLKYTVKKLKKGVKYKIKVRAVAKIGSSVKYSAFSKVKTFKAK